MMYKNAQFPIILATIGVSKKHRAFKVCVCHSPDLNPIGHLWENLEWRLRQRFPPPSKHKIIEFLVEERCRISPIEFRTLVEPMKRRIEAVLTRGGPIPY
jgi:hypothetical protein